LYPFQFHEKPNDDDGAAQVASLLSLARSAGAPMGVLPREKPDGALAQRWHDAADAGARGASPLPQCDVSAALGRVMAPKEEGELLALRRAAHLSSSMLEKCALAPLESTVDAEERAKQASGPAAGASASAPLLRAITVWVKRTDVAGAQYDFCKNVDPQQLVAEFIARWIAQEKLDVSRSLVTLRLVKCADSEPTVEEEADAEQLRPRLTLAAAGVTDGCSLLLAYVETGARAVSNHACCTHANTLRTQARRCPPLRWLHARWRCRSWTRRCSRCECTTQHWRRRSCPMRLCQAM
jgi:hypothetical protein